jgi:putative FmdB family regulatory protein
MPIYVYRCLDCGLSLDINHSFEDTYNGDCNGCGGVLRKHFGAVHISASATSGVHDGKDIDWSGSKTKEREKERDMAAYKRLRSEGLHPPSIDGSADLEIRAGNKWEVKAGHILPEKGRKNAESQLQEILE